MTTILQGIGWFLLKIYELFENLGLPGAYALALIVFTILIKVVLFPLSYKGKKSMMKMNSLQVKLKQLEVQYGKDRERYQEKMQELYAKENVNPMGGCLWSMIPLFILIPLYSIIRQPMVYMLGLSKEAVELALTAAQNAGAVFTGNAGYYEIQLASMLSDNGILNAVSAAIPEYADKLQAINFNLFGINLGAIPKLSFWTTFDSLGVWCSVGLFLIPLIVTAFNFLYTKYSQKTNAAFTAPAAESKKKKNDGKPEQKSSAERSSQMMMWMMPLMYLWFGYSMPAGMCVYMLANALATMVQDKVCLVIMKPGYERMLAEQKERDEREKAEIAARKAEIAERRRRQQEEEKANKGKKKGKKPVKKAAPANKNGRIGIRTYALGRDYDPDRYGGVTPYRDPQDIIDEQAIEDARQTKHKRKVADVEKAIARAEEDGDIDRLKALEEEAAALEAAAEETEVEETAALPAAEDVASDEDTSEEE